MARLDARWLNFWEKGQDWYHFWQDTPSEGGISLIVHDASHAHSADNITIIAHIPTFSLMIQDASHSHSSDDVIVTVHIPVFSLSVQDSTHIHSADNVSLTQHQILAVDDSSHIHSADNVTITEYIPTFVLTVQDIIHEHTADNVNLRIDTSPPTIPPAVLSPIVSYGVIPKGRHIVIFVHYNKNKVREEELLIMNRK